MSDPFKIAPRPSKNWPRIRINYSFCKHREPPQSARVGLPGSQRRCKTACNRSVHGIRHVGWITIKEWIKCYYCHVTLQSAAHARIQSLRRQSRAMAWKLHMNEDLLNLYIIHDALKATFLSYVERQKYWSTPGFDHHSFKYSVNDAAAICKRRLRSDDRLLYATSTFNGPKDEFRPQFCRSKFHLGLIMCDFVPISATLISHDPVAKIPVSLHYIQSIVPNAPLDSLRSQQWRVWIRTLWMGRLLRSRTRSKPTFQVQTPGRSQEIWSRMRSTFLQTWKNLFPLASTSCSVLQRIRDSHSARWYVKIMPFQNPLSSEFPVNSGQILAWP